MSFENSAGINVKNHYGPRAVGGTVGSKHTTDNARIYNLDLDTAPPQSTPADVYVQAGTLVQAVIFEGTAGTATVSVGGVEITAADYAAPIAVPAGGNLTYTKGTGAGKVKVVTLTPEA